MNNNPWIYPCWACRPACPECGTPVERLYVELIKEPDDFTSPFRVGMEYVQAPLEPCGCTWESRRGTYMEAEFYSPEPFSGRIEHTQVVFRETTPATRDTNYIIRTTGEDDPPDCTRKDTA